MLEHKGENNYLTGRKGLSLGVWSRFITTPEGDGVMVVPGNLSDGESAQDQVIASWKVLN